ncbi:hypothetical protein GCM10011504_32040 [Siccirubricoccus deserti]|uniref:Ion transporter n=1 Tax=Siccirubricoccus deserti TaxID=2013562 RepID=A0A9X0R1W5_9PROT|nr:ion transporter [Siccirubricoccus deserti]MBC4016802.1 ion transporter [Siccirubricoccus deserti]GGC51236.1 hypothetical protein GCM10011504_32040 [Siccirubricoccus deserti]
MTEALTADDAGASPRARAARLVSTPGFQRAVAGLILLNAGALGLETWPPAVEALGGLLRFVDRAAVLLFSAEILLRIYAYRGRFFRDPWGVFDLLVVAIAWLPAGTSLSVLRAFRILRVLRLASVVPSLRLVVEAMLASVPGMASIILLMSLLFYVAGVIATSLYGDIAPDRFGSLGASLFTLFQMMTLESWAEATVRPILEQRPHAWMFFVPFILIATFVVLNLFLGVIVSSIQTLSASKASEEAEAARAETQADIATVLRELRMLRAEVAAQRAPSPPG